MADRTLLAANAGPDNDDMGRSAYTLQYRKISLPCEGDHEQPRRGKQNMRFNSDAISGSMTLFAGGVLSLSTIITDDLIVCFALATLGAFGAMGLAKDARNRIWEAIAGVCIGTAGSMVILRMGVGSPFPELAALVLGIGGLVAPLTVRKHLGAWIVELKEKFFPPKVDIGSARIIDRDAEAEAEAMKKATEKQGGGP